MKKLFYLFALLFVCLSTYGQEEHQAQLIPAGSGHFPIAADSVMKGGHRALWLKSSMNNIDVLRRSPGMTVYVVQTDSTYRITNDLSSFYAVAPGNVASALNNRIVQRYAAATSNGGATDSLSHNSLVRIVQDARQTFPGGVLALYKGAYDVGVRPVYGPYLYNFLKNGQYEYKFGALIDGNLSDTTKFLFVDVAEDGVSIASKYIRYSDFRSTTQWSYFNISFIARAGHGYEFRVDVFHSDGITPTQYPTQVNFLYDYGQILPFNEVNMSDLSTYVPKYRKLTINGQAYDLSADRSWNIGVGNTYTSGYGINLSGYQFYIDSTLIKTKTSALVDYNALKGLINSNYSAIGLKQSSLLKNYVIGSNVIVVAGDSVGGAIGKLQAQLNNKQVALPVYPVGQVLNGNGTSTPSANSRVTLTTTGVLQVSPLDSLGVETGSLSFTSPNRTPGLVMLDASGVSRSQLRLLSGGGIAFSAGSGSTRPADQILFNKNGKISYVSAPTTYSNLEIPTFGYNDARYAQLSGNNTWTGVNTFNSGVTLGSANLQLLSGSILSYYRSGYTTFLDVVQPTQNQTIYFPNKAGIIALLTDIPSRTPIVMSGNGTLALLYDYENPTATQFSWALPSVTGDFSVNGTKLTTILVDGTGSVKITVPNGYTVKTPAGQTHSDGTGYVIVNSLQKVQIIPNGTNSFYIEPFVGSLTIY